MVLANQDGPFGTGLAVPLRLSRTPVHNSRAGLRLPECICACINRIRENLQDGVVDGKFPNHLGLTRVARQRGKGDVLLSEPQQDLSRTPYFDHFGEDELESLLYAL